MKEVVFALTGRYSPLSLTAVIAQVSLDFFKRSGCERREARGMHTTQFELIGFCSFFFDPQRERWLLSVRTVDLPVVGRRSSVLVGGLDRAIRSLGREGHAKRRHGGAACDCITSRVYGRRVLVMQEDKRV